MYLSDKRSKLVATIGPSSDNKEVLKKLVLNGVTCIRANFSHGDHAEQGKKFALAREVSEELNVPISTMLDTKGPEIRVGKMKDGIQTIERDSIVEIFTTREKYENFEGTSKQITVEYEMDKDLKVGNKVLIDDGKLTCEVIEIKPGIVVVKAKNTHKVKTNKRVNLPGVEFSLPFLSEKDKTDILFGIKEKVNYVAASFVNKAENVLELRKLLDDNGGEKIKIISKIESLAGCNNLDAIIEVTDGIMVARGDLGLEIPYYEVPYWEKVMIRKSRNAGKPVIVATQMLDSMENNPHPTRAEVTDVYYATELGADATMLSGESANGKFPVEAVQTMSAINQKAEQDFYNKLYYAVQLEEVRKAAPNDLRSQVAYDLAKKTEDGTFKFAVVLSDAGRLLERVAMFRPNTAIIGMVKDPDIVNNFGVTSSVFISLESKALFDIVQAENDHAETALVAYGAKKGDKYLIANNEELIERVVS
ncbi:pyruvate kinase [Mycoplasma testudineum]|uniref:Pyruvate kinase n=1 Tax=Mycoplasma testudineum TaxID=244584 RepID=A0A4R6IHE2_9MOLU|nr:pyruvate kinase [Mycoplasma testudineum]OYD26946.1 pyruvate kinase [Mycoplasma testudineum]TDO20495.1 pyruvate kinase [Mycoplasma testudineum]